MKTHNLSTEEYFRKAMSTVQWFAIATFCIATLLFLVVYFIVDENHIATLDGILFLTSGLQYVFAKKAGDNLDNKKEQETKTSEAGKEQPRTEQA